MKTPTFKKHARKQAAGLPEVPNAQYRSENPSGRNRVGGAAVHSRAERLQLQIQQELGIDMRRYASEEAVATLADLLSFPQYVFAYMLRPLRTALLMFALGFVFLDLLYIEYLLFLLLMATTLFFGLLALGSAFRPTAIQNRFRAMPELVFADGLAATGKSDKCLVVIKYLFSPFQT